MDSEWMDEGLCRQVPPSTFFPNDGVGVDVARRICASCPVQAPCLEYALVQRIDHGVWGGGVLAPTLQDPAPLALGRTAPDAVVDALDQGVLEAGGLDGTGGADAPGHVDAHPVVGEERRRRHLAAQPLIHPVRVHRASGHTEHTEQTSVWFPVSCRRELSDEDLR